MGLAAMNLLSTKGAQQERVSIPPQYPTTLSTCLWSIQRNTKTFPRKLALKESARSIVIFPDASIPLMNAGIVVVKEFGQSHLCEYSGFDSSVGFLQKNVDDHS